MRGARRIANVGKHLGIWKWRYFEVSTFGESGLKSSMCRSVREIRIPKYIRVDNTRKKLGNGSVETFGEAWLENGGWFSRSSQSREALQKKWKRTGGVAGRLFGPVEPCLSSFASSLLFNHLSSPTRLRFQLLDHRVALCGDLGSEIESDVTFDTVADTFTILAI